MRYTNLFLLFLISMTVQAQAEWETIKTEHDEFLFKAIYHASMAFKFDTLTVLIDPHGDEKSFKEIGTADLIVITDFHFDHYDEQLLEKITGKSTTFISTSTVVSRMPQAWKEKATILKNGQSTEFLDMTITAFPMYNMPLSPNAHHAKGIGNGYFIEWKGFKIYISGDTGNIPEMTTIQDVDMAFVCMNQPYTMTVEDAAKAVNTFKPKVIYPYHYRNGDKSYSDLNKFSELVSSDEINCVLVDWYAK